VALGKRARSVAGNRHGGRNPNRQFFDSSSVSGASGRYMESAILFINNGKVWDTRPETTSDSIAVREYFRTINVAKSCTSMALAGSPMLTIIKQIKELPAELQVRSLQAIFPVANRSRLNSLISIR